jgi:hypothetical protein
MKYIKRRGKKESRLVIGEIQDMFTGNWYYITKSRGGEVINISFKEAVIIHKRNGDR